MLGDAIASKSDTNIASKNSALQTTHGEQLLWENGSKVAKKVQPKAIHFWGVLDL